MQIYPTWPIILIGMALLKDVKAGSGGGGEVTQWITMTTTCWSTQWSEKAVTQWETTTCWSTVVQPPVTSIETSIYTEVYTRPVTYINVVTETDLVTKPVTVMETITETDIVTKPITVMETITETDIVTKPITFMETMTETTTDVSVSISISFKTVVNDVTNTETAIQTQTAVRTATAIEQSIQLSTETATASITSLSLIVSTYITTVYVHQTETITETCATVVETAAPVTITPPPVIITPTTSTLVGLVTCESRTINPTYTTSTPLPSDYLWGCPPGKLCKPKQVNCNFEQNLPADGYYCSPDECVVPEPLKIDTNAPDVNYSCGTLFTPLPGYFYFNPTTFGYDFRVFATDGQTATPCSTSLPVTQISDGQPQAPKGTSIPVGPTSTKSSSYSTSLPVTQISDGQPQAPTGASKWSEQSYTSVVSQYHDGQAYVTKRANIKERQPGLYDVPGICMDNCQSIAVVAQEVGLASGLCPENSPFSAFLHNCRSCITSNKNVAYNSVTPLLNSLRTFLNYCSSSSIPPPQAISTTQQVTTLSTTSLPTASPSSTSPTSVITTVIPSSTTPATSNTSSSPASTPPTVLSTSSTVTTSPASSTISVPPSSGKASLIAPTKSNFWLIGLCMFALLGI